MKSFIVVALLAAICAVVKTEDVCHSSMVTACTSTTLSEASTICNSHYGGINSVEPEVQAYINSHLTKSYEYLLLATHFNSYQKNRLGFQKLYQRLSDRSFDDTIDMIKHLSLRGSKANFKIVHETPDTISRKPKNLEVDELYSLAIALDTEKQLSTGAFHIHTHALHSTERDPEIAHYIEEKFLGKQAETVRKLSGYTNDLLKLMNEQERSMALYLFDEYLQKQ